MQLHKRMTNDQVRMVLDWYEVKIITRKEALLKLDVKERRFFKLLHLYRSRKLEIIPKRTNAHRKISPYLNRLIKVELENEKSLVKNREIPLSCYNFTAIKDEIARKYEQKVSVKTISRRAHDWGYMNPPKIKRSHDRIVLTTTPGLLLQHDASTHLWAPFSSEKWTLITTIDDYSRLLLCAHLVKEESAAAHIKAVESVITRYGVGANYYADNHSIFRFVRKTDGIWHSPRVSISDVKTQWERTVKECGMGVVHALSPEAKGKVERPYRWLQDRIVRRCAKEEIKTIEEARIILADEVERYNNHQVHSTTGEIPRIRFEKAQKKHNSAFRPFVLPKPFTSIKDIFCIKESRIVNGYGQISFRHRYLEIPKHVPEGARIMVHLYDDSQKPEIRLWYKEVLAQVIVLGPKN